MPLLPSDEEFLKERNFNYTVEEIPGETLLIIKDYSISSMFDLDKTDVLIRIPKGYPTAQLDMFWVRPYVKIKSTNNYPPAANDFGSSFLGDKWQRFSRHYTWKPTYDLSKHLSVVKEVLVNGRG